MSKESKGSSVGKSIVTLMLMVIALIFVGCEKDPTRSDHAGEAEGDWVDLGLPSGLMWATRNIGAASPEDYGDYFAWGETQTKSVYDWSTYRYVTIDGESGTLTKYNTSSSHGEVDNLTTLQPSDDAATANWGGGARTPTIAEWDELMANTSSQWTTRNGVNGRLLTAANGNSLFLPAAGDRKDSSLDDAGSIGNYWSSSLYTGDPGGAWNFCFDSDYQLVGYYYRGSGLSVRAVRQN